LIRVDLQAKTWQLLDSPDNLETMGFDGLYYHRGTLVGIQNGIQPWRALQLQLSENGLRVVSATVLEMKNPKLTSATTGAVVGDSFYYMARGVVSQPPATLPPSIHPFLGSTYIMRAPLAPGT